MSHPYQTKRGLAAVCAVIVLFAAAGARSAAASADPAEPKLESLPMSCSQPPFEALAQRHAALAAEGRTLNADIAAFNARYSTEVPVTSPEHGAAVAAESALGQRKQRYYAAVAEMNAALASARRTADRLQELRARLVKTQQALAALGRSMNENSAELEHWADVTAESVADAEELGQELAMEAFVARTAAGMKSMCGTMRVDVDGRLKHVTDLLTKTGAGPEREKLSQLVRLLKDEQAAVMKLQALAPAVVEGPMMTRTAVEQLAPDVRRLLEAAGRSRLEMIAIGAAATGAALSPHLGVARISVQTAYDLTAISLACSRIAQGNRNADQNLAAVKSLGTLVHRLVADIQETKEDRPR